MADLNSPLAVSSSPNGKAKLRLKAPKRTKMADLNSLDACTAPGSAQSIIMPRRKKKNESLLDTLRSWIVQHQIGLSINLLLLHALAHMCLPRARTWTRLFFELSYYDAPSGQYNRGPEDFYFVTYWIVIFMGLRAAVMSYVLLPTAKAMGIRKTKTKIRFAEQAWLFIYDGSVWSLGMYIMYHSKYWLNLPELWTDFPVRLMSGLFKWYYLVQFAFWLQQIVVVNIEERRKDHWQMFTHHIVTCLLIVSSLGYYQTRTGNVILCIMDIVDITLPFAKMLKYAGFQTSCDIAFGVFIVSWFVARHVCYFLVCLSIYRDVPYKMVYGCHSSVTGEMLSHQQSPAFDTPTTPGGNEILRNIMQPFADPGGPICYNERIRFSFLGLLLVLQGIMIMWFIMIIRVAWNVIKGHGADDSRSDDEEDADVDEVDENVPLKAEIPPPVAAPPIEQTVGVEGLNLRRRAGPMFTSRRGGGPTSGISIPGHADKKELLGRIGCDKPS